MPITFHEPMTLAVWSGSVFLVKATIILAAGVAITRLMSRASAGARHLVWLAILGTLLVLPVLTTWARLEIPLLPPLAATLGAERSATPVRQQPLVPPAASGSRALPHPSLGGSDAHVGEVAGATDARPTVLAPAVHLSGVSLFVATWAGVVLCILVSLVWSSLAVRRIVGRARALEQPDWRTPLLEVADRLGLAEPPRLLVSRDTNMPFACGLVTPTIVLPEESDRWPLARRRAVLLHELAHVRRRDLAGHVLGRVVCAFYWFHPLAWVAAKRLRLESERACDDLALTCGTRATDYAEHLLDIVVAVRANATPVVALAMARRQEFEGRMLAILDPERPRSTPSRRQSAALIASLAFSASLVAAAAPVPRASDSLRDEIVPDRMSVPTSQAAGAREIAAEERPGSSDGRLRRAPSAAAMSPTLTTHPALPRTVTDQLNSNPDAIARASSASAASLAGSWPAPSGALSAHLGFSRADQGAPDDRADLLAKVLRSDSSANLRRIAAWGLEQHTDSPNGVAALVYAVRRDADASVREMSAWALASTDAHDSVTEALIATLRSDPSARVRATAAWAIGSVSSGPATSALSAALADSSREVRMRAVWALGNVEPRRECHGVACLEYLPKERAAPAALVGMLKDRDAEIRRLVAWSLYQIEDPAALPALEAALRTETDEETQLAYLRAIAVMGDKSVDVIQRLIESPDPRIKSAAVRALAGGHAAGPWPWPWPEPRPEP